MTLADIDDCSPGVCKNGGTCHDGVNTYMCSCAAGYTGPNCNNGEYIVSFCLPTLSQIYSRATFLTHTYIYIYIRSGTRANTPLHAYTHIHSPNHLRTHSPPYAISLYLSKFHIYSHKAYTDVYMYIQKHEITVRQVSYHETSTKPVCNITITKTYSTAL